MAAEEINPDEEPDRLSRLLDAFEELLPAEQKHAIERADAYLRVHGFEALREPKDSRPPQEEIK